LTRDKISLPISIIPHPRVLTRRRLSASITQSWSEHVESGTFRRRQPTNANQIHSLGSLALAAGGFSLPFSCAAAAAVQAAAHGEERIVWGACSVNCGSRCALRLHVRDDEVVWVETDNTGDG
jgi:hypothetical protein